MAVWDTTTGYRIKKVTGHSSFVNSCCPARRGDTFVSGSDDGTARLWDLRAARKPVATFKQKYQVTAVCLSDDATQLFSGGIDNTIHCWDLREASSSSSSNDAGGADAAPPPVFSLKGHMDTITGISLSPDGSFLLSNAMDSTARIWDVRPFVSGGESQRCTGVMGGHQHNFEKLLLKASWSADGTLVGVGSADCQVCVFDVADSTLKYRLPGHGCAPCPAPPLPSPPRPSPTGQGQVCIPWLAGWMTDVIWLWVGACIRGSVNEVAFHPKQPIIGSCSSDMSCFLGEIDAKWDVSGAGVGGLAGDNLAAPPS